MGEDDAELSEHPGALPASPEVGFAHGRVGYGGCRASSGYWGGQSRAVPSTRRPAGEPGSSA